MSQNEEEITVKGEMDEHISIFKDWMEDKGFDVDDYNDTAWQVFELITTHQTFTAQLAAYRQQMMEEQNPSETGKEDSNIIQSDFN